MKYCRYAFGLFVVFIIGVIVGHHTLSVEVLDVPPVPRYLLVEVPLANDRVCRDVVLLHVLRVVENGHIEDVDFSESGNAKWWRVQVGGRVYFGERE